MDKDEVTNILVHALNNSDEGFSTFKTMFNECANAFEIGEDKKGLEIISSLIEPLQDFCSFCADMLQTHAHMMEKDTLRNLEEQCEMLEKLMGELIKEMEDGNFVEVGDILKYDFGDLASKMSKSFPEVAISIEKYEVAENC